MTAEREHQPGQHIIRVTDKPRLKRPTAIPEVHTKVSELCPTTFFIELSWLVMFALTLNTEKKHNLHRNLPPLNDEVMS